MEFTWLSRWQPQLLATLRMVAALLYIQHPFVKLFNFPPGAMPGLQQVGSFLWFAGVIELVTSILIFFGFFTRLAAFIAAGEMAVAYWTVHVPQGPYPVLNMGELAALYCFVFLYIAAAGPGAWSVDGARFRSRMSAVEQA